MSYHVTCYYCGHMGHTQRYCYTWFVREVIVGLPQVEKARILAERFPNGVPNSWAWNGGPANGRGSDEIKPKSWSSAEGFFYSAITELSWEIDLPRVLFKTTYCWQDRYIPFFVTPDASHHFTNDDDLARNFTPLHKPFNIRCIGGVSVQATKQGDIRVTNLYTGRRNIVQNVLYVKELGTNVLSIPELTAKGYTVRLGCTDVKIEVDGYTFLTGG